MRTSEGIDAALRSTIASPFFSRGLADGLVADNGLPGLSAGASRAGSRGSAEERERRSSLAVNGTGREGEASTSRRRRRGGDGVGDGSDIETSSARKERKHVQERQ